MKRDFSAVMRIGIILFQESDNPQNEPALRKFIYSFKPFVPDDELDGVINVANLLDFDTAAVIVCRLGDKEHEWARGVLYDMAVAEGQMNAAQKRRWDRLEEIYSQAPGLW